MRVFSQINNCQQNNKTKQIYILILDGLNIFSYGPHPNTQGGSHNVPLGGGVVAVLFWSGKNPEKENNSRSTFPDEKCILSNLNYFKHKEQRSVILSQSLFQSINMAAR